MTININKNAGVNFSFKAQNISENKHSSETAEQKTAEADLLSALDAMGRAFVKVSEASAGAGLKNLENTDLPQEAAEDLMKLPEEKREEALKLYEEGIIPAGLLVPAVLIDEDIKPKMLDIINRGISAKNAVIDNRLNLFSDKKPLEKPEIIKKYDSIIEFLDKKTNPDTINFLLQNDAELNDKTIARGGYLYEKIFSQPEKAMKNAFSFSVKDILDADDKTYKKAVSLIEGGMSILDNIYLIAAGNNDGQKLLKLFNEGFTEEEIDLINTFNIKDAHKIKEIAEKYSLPFKAAVSVSILSGQYPEEAQKLLEQDCKERLYLLELDFTGELLDEAVKLIKEGGLEDIAKTFMEDAMGSDKPAFRKLLKRNEQLNKKWAEFIANSQQGAELNKQLDKKDVYFLKTHVFEDECRYTPEEYTSLFIYLKNLKTPEGKNIIGSETFSDRVKANGLGDFAANAEDMLYKNLELFMSLDPAAQKTNDIKAVLELMKEGKVNSAAFRKLSDLNDLNDDTAVLTSLNFDLLTGKKRESTWEVSNNLHNDIKLINDAHSDDINIKDKYIPAYKNESEGVKNTKTGGAFILEGEKFIRIKTDDNKSETVKLTKETYAKLFPPVERFLTTQSVMGNCYCIETLMSMYSNDNTRINLLRTMSEDNKGNITIKIGDYEPVTLKNGRLPENENPEIYSSGADGFKLFEYAYSCALVQDKIKEAQDSLSGAELAKFNKFIKSNPDNFFIYKDNGQTKYCTYTEALEKGLYKLNSKSPFGMQSYKTFNNFLLGNGGLQNDVYGKLGYNCGMYIKDEVLMLTSKKEILNAYKKQGVQIDNISSLTKAERLMHTPDFFKNNQVQIGLGMHAYCLTQETDENGREAYYLYNPHNHGFPIKFNNLKDMLEKASMITVVKIK